MVKRWMIATVVAFLAIGALAWNAGEQHYRGCVEAAIARTRALPAVSDDPLFQSPTVGELLRSSGDRESRLDAISGCSRLP